MQINTEWPRAVRELEHVWIPMPDGCRLSARIWLPDDAETHPVPAILEYIPYRKGDLRTDEDSINHPYYAGHGYAGVRVDIRGSGESEGVLTDEYTQQELDDGLVILSWLAAQPWCTGRVGMLGISWGGFNGLQVAALQPPELHAVITVCSTDDRYADDVHYMGGCMLAENPSWAGVMFAHNSCPPDPRLFGDGWREDWFERLRGSGLWLDTWASHQTRDEYWRHGSVCEDFSAIQCPVYAISGWADGYSNAVFRLMQHLEVPRRALVGPWSHKYPHLGKPGPAIGFLQDSLRWWDYWLKDEPTGIMEEPQVRVWMQDSVRPATRYKERPGRWVAENEWPAPHIQAKHLTLSSEGLIGGDTSKDSEALLCRSPLRTGLSAGKWCSYSAGPDMPGDQREADANSLSFDTEPLSEALEIFGAPVVELVLASDQPQAQVAVRLCDVAPDGASTRVTYGVLNLSHRNSHAEPEALVPGEPYRVRVQLNEIAQHFPAGHRIRVSVSSSYWPLIWPSPEPTALTLWSEVSTLTLPERKPSEADRSLPEFAPPEGALRVAKTEIEPEATNWRLHYDFDADTHTLEVDDSEGIFHLDATGTDVQKSGFEQYRIQGDDVHSAEVETLWRMGFARKHWRVDTETWARMSCTAEAFHIEATLRAYEDGELVYEQDWDRRIPRDHL